MAVLVGGLRLEVSLGTWGPDPVLDQFLCDTQQGVLSDQKPKSRNGSGSHFPSETSRHRPPTALKLGSEDSKLNGAYALQVW